MVSDSKLDNGGHAFCATLLRQVSSGKEDEHTEYIYVQQVHGTYVRGVRIYKEMCFVWREAMRDKYSRRCCGKVREKRRKREIRKRSKTKEAKQSVNNAHYPVSLLGSHIRARATHSFCRGCEYQSLFVGEERIAMRVFQKEGRRKNFSAVYTKSINQEVFNNALRSLQIHRVVQT